MSNGDFTAKAEPSTVLDAGPLIHLDELECLDLLEGLGGLAVPTKVVDEATGYRPSLSLDAIPGLRVVADAAPIGTRLQTLARTLSLDEGELRALALLEALAGRKFLCDDAAARLAGEALGFEVRGTIGLLLRSIRRGTRSKQEIRLLIEELPLRSSLHVRRSLLKAVTAQLG